MRFHVLGLELSGRCAVWTACAWSRSTERMHGFHVLGLELSGSAFAGAALSGAWSRVVRRCLVRLRVCRLRVCRCSLGLQPCQVLGLDCRCAVGARSLGLGLWGFMWAWSLGLHVGAVSTFQLRGRCAVSAGAAFSCARSQQAQQAQQVQPQLFMGAASVQPCQGRGLVRGAASVQPFQGRGLFSCLPGLCLFSCLPGPAA
jgi:hypothetical protein